MSVRHALHAGSWYTSNAKELDCQLSDWLEKPSALTKPARAIITPHAGYRYSGPCAAYAYKQLDPKSIKRVFVLGPSHHVDIGSKCALSSATLCQTPIGDLSIDTEVYNSLSEEGSFITLSQRQDEEEHSVEMQFPYIMKVMKNYADQFTIVPVVVGDLNVESQAHYGKLFAQYLADPNNVFIISSDFCHWGTRFNYQYYIKSDGPIWQSIEKLDRLGMEAIKSLKPSVFTRYLQETRNTICGRRPIGILLNALQTLHERAGTDFELQFVNYAQSSKCYKMDDSSVSYAAATVTLR